MKKARNAVPAHKKGPKSEIQRPEQIMKKRVIEEKKAARKQKGGGKQRMGDATGGGRLETKGRERKNNDVTRSTTRKRTINSPTCIFDGPKRTLFYTPRDGGIKAAGKS